MFYTFSQYNQRYLRRYLQLVYTFTLIQTFKSCKVNMSNPTESKKSTGYGDQRQSEPCEYNKEGEK